MRKFLLIAAIAVSTGGWLPVEQQVLPPQAPPFGANPDSLKLAVIGDNGNGDKVEYEVGQQMALAHARFPFELVLMSGDNMLGRQEPGDFVSKFEQPYAALVQAGIPFYASLGNHDNPSNVFYKGFNMGGRRYYTFVRKNVRFVVLDTNLMDPPQVAWVEDTLKQAREEWIVCYFHHPLYSDGGRHGSNLELRVVLEPLFVRYGVDVVFAGHDHVYERIKPQKGITYFVEGSSGQLRKGDVKKSEITAAAFDQDQTFILVDINGDDMMFQVISRTGQIVDSGVIHQRPTITSGGTS